MPYLVTSECIQCGACISGCPSDAIVDGEVQSHINPAICVECGTCESNCPVQAIIFVEEPDLWKYPKELGPFAEAYPPPEGATLPDAANTG